MEIIIHFNLIAPDGDVLALTRDAMEHEQTATYELPVVGNINPMR